VSENDLKQLAPQETRARRFSFGDVKFAELS
jgi:hypothetical protein